MNAIAPQPAPRSVPALPSAQELDRSLHDASPAEIVAAALKTVGREKLALVISPQHAALTERFLALDRIGGRPARAFLDADEARRWLEEQPEV